MGHQTDSSREISIWVKQHALSRQPITDMDSSLKLVSVRSSRPRRARKPMEAYRTPLGPWNGQQQQSRSASGVTYAPSSTPSNKAMMMTAVQSDKQLLQAHSSSPFSMAHLTQECLGKASAKLLLAQPLCEHLVAISTATAHRSSIYPRDCTTCSSSHFVSSRPRRPISSGSFNSRPSSAGRANVS